MSKKNNITYNLSSLEFLKNLARLYYGLGKFLLLLLVMIILGAYIISVFDHKHFADSLYLSFITATTVGYGDITPVSYASKLVAVILGLIGIVLTGLIVGITIEAIRLSINE
jgi:voltage-gated potassium channel